MTHQNPRRDDLHLPAGGTTTGPWAVSVTPETASWSYSGLRVLTLEPGGRAELQFDRDEAIVLPLAGGCAVECDGQRLDLTGRTNVFAAVTDFAYLPLGSTTSVSSTGGGRFALLTARATRRLPFRYGPARDVPVELRGAGNCSRQVNNFATPGVFETDKLIACEVLTPGGNWSSYPPHKHDQARPDESVLEEIYYFEVRDGANGPGMGYQRVYASETGPADTLTEVRTGDVVLVPYGWHGPSMATPGYDLYYLNVMAGPAPERAWLICDDPAHAWVRNTWTGMAVDPRLPMTSAETRGLS
ncbi:5-deoxy-glucuronate isomerase [Rugosimonospora acidiphila]|uniref:5-deoxy-glucuronate isomerase n=1 Tax=Rugosimonospora acidiphila TaxID=556531 RepID=A0ABP9RTM0_9ACTN